MHGTQQNCWQKQGDGQRLLSLHHYGGGVCRGWVTAQPEIIQSWISLCLCVCVCAQRHIWVMTERLKSVRDKDGAESVVRRSDCSSQWRRQSGFSEVRSELEMNGVLKGLSARGDTDLLSLISPAFTPCALTHSNIHFVISKVNSKMCL